MVNNYWSYQYSLMPFLFFFFVSQFKSCSYFFFSLLFFSWLFRFLVSYFLSWKTHSCLSCFYQISSM
ncbi:hypothetical protein BCR39DRAFT_552168 [Naematelia encephala]|uniref:Uncharacterized protein n=1 Tax=Naematelia encephala TaxID=71784 RepID=A0A1Y2AHY9_9TREE|nr:hypothetical protein BCR39DRAFT_552168 [Naematelia encephala]